MRDPKHSQGSVSLTAEDAVFLAFYYELSGPQRSSALRRLLPPNRLASAIRTGTDYCKSTSYRNPRTLDPERWSLAWVEGLECLSGGGFQPWGGFWEQAWPVQWKMTATASSATPPLLSAHPTPSPPQSPPPASPPLHRGKESGGERQTAGHGENPAPGQA